jgi:hypothetical protein
MKIRALLLAVAGVALLAACSPTPSAPSVPALSASAGGTAAAAAGAGADRSAALHAAAECIRQHGVPTYQDPVLDANGHVYTDARSIQDAGQASGNKNGIEDSLRQACGTLITAAGFQPADQAPAPPALVQAGVKAAACLRANGLPNYRDPTTSSTFTPGHGFAVTDDELPSTGGGKADPTVQKALAACRALLDEEINQSTLTALAHD